MTKRNKAIGDAGEQLALNFLLKQGYSLIVKNYRCPGGECDIIMQKDEEIVLVEVKVRNSSKFGDAIESITPKKMKSMERCVAHYYKEQDEIPFYRIDAVLIQNGELNHLQNITLD